MNANAILPAVHKDPKRAQELFDSYLAASMAVRDAIAALSRIEIAQGDYAKHADTEAWAKAKSGMRDEVTRLMDTQERLMQVIEHVQRFTGDDLDTMAKLING